MKGPFGSRNFRLYFSGQAVSLVGTWMQQVASSWLVLTLSHSGTVLGLAVATQMLPILVLGSWGGLISDRVNKRHLLMITQVLLGLTSLVLGILIVTDWVELWMVFALSAVLGIVNSVANPARQSFVSELVVGDQLRQAISFNSVLVNASRAIGPAVAGVLIATVGIELCFFIDAASYLFVIAALIAMKTADLLTSDPAVRAKGQIREGLRYVRSVPRLYVPLLMMFLIGTLAYEFQVLLPLVASETFRGNASSLGILTSSQGAGAIVGGLYVARRGHIGIKAITRGALLFGSALILASLAPTFVLECVALFLVGAASVQFLSVGNSTLQLSTDSQFRGRVMALWTIAFLGSTPLGGPIVGWVGEHLSPRIGLGLGALSCFLAALIGVAAIAKIRREKAENAAAGRGVYASS